MSCGSKEQKETVMVLKVDLDCEQCYKKVKRVLCKFPQIRNQVYDAKNNTVTITVLCCSPEKIRDKLCCKAGKSIKSIEIKQPSKPKPKPKPALGPAESEKPKPAPETGNPAVGQQKVKGAPEQKPPDKTQKNGSKNGSNSKKGDAAAELASKSHEAGAQWVPGYPPGPSPQIMSVSVCCAPCYEGRPRPPCDHTCPPGPPYPYGYCVRPCPPSYCGCCCDCLFPSPYCGCRCDCLCPPPYCSCRCNCLCPPPYCSCRCDC